MLLISYAFPPDRTVGALRWQKMLQCLGSRGWSADVITLAPATIDDVGLAALAELPPGTRVYGVPAHPMVIRRVERLSLAAARTLQRTARAKGGASAEREQDVQPRVPSVPVGSIRWRLGHSRGWMRAYYSWIEHAQIARWARAAAGLAIRLDKSRRYEVIVTSSPPHMTHEAGRRAAALTGVPLVVDFRDPWSLSDRLYDVFASPLWLHLARRYERRVVEAAALVVANTDPLATALAARYPRARRVIAVTNGTDAEPLPSSTSAPRFTIRYAGTIYSERDPATLFEAAAVVVRDLSLTPEEFGIDLIGEFGDDGGARITRLADAAGIAAFVTVSGRRSRRDALEFLAGATMLVSFPNFSETVAISAKLFEYMRFNAWLLALASPGSAVRQLLAGTDADVASPTDAAEVAAHIRVRLLSYRRGQQPPRIAGEPRFTREYQAARLDEALRALPLRPPLK